MTKTSDWAYHFGMKNDPGFVGRTTIAADSGRETSMKDEYDAMVALHSILGDQAVKPHEYSAEGEFDQYTMEMIDGDTLEDVMFGPAKYHYDSNDIIDFISQIKEIQSKLKQSGIEHGDIKAGNFLVDGKTKRVKLFDPAGFKAGESRSSDSDNINFKYLYNVLNKFAQRGTT